MAHGENLINIPGELHSVASDGVVASADAIKDYNKGKTQEQVNQEVDADLSDIKSEQAILQTAIDNEKTRAESVEATKANADDVYTRAQGTALENQVNSAISQQDQIIDERLDAQDDKIEALEKQEVVIVNDHEAVENPNPTTIYRETSEDGSSYTDWMYQGEWKKLATYGFPGIDEEPTPDSENLAKSGGIANIYGSYTENPEFAYVQKDNKDKILFGVKQDGSMYFGEGCPTQVKDYIDEKLTELSLDEYPDIVAFLSDYLGSDTTLKAMIDSINERIPEIIGNPVFFEVTTDSEDKVLEGIKSDGTKVIGGDLNVGGSTSINGDTKILGSMEVSGVSYKVIENPEFWAAWVDAEDKTILGFKTDGKTYVGDADFLNEIKNNQEAIDEIKSYLANFDSLDIDALSFITTVENPNFIEVKTDSEGKLLAGRTPDGAAFENVGLTTPKVSIEGHIIENIEDPEGRSEVKTDKEGRLLSYRDKDGILNECVGIKSDKIIGYDTNPTDYSNSSELHIPEPYCAKVNFVGIDDMPQSKGVDMHGYMEFWDMQGNYFRKEVIMNAQGQSSMSHPKKNISIDICNNNGWDDDDTFKLQIGNWVPQDSFHLKSYYNDPFRGIGAVAYKWFDQITRTRGELGDYIWKKALLDFDSITPTSNGSTTAKDTEEQYNTGAKCFPDGFPCIVYLNGEFYGIYSWQLKKHRDNYHMSKKSVKHIHLDGMIGDDLLFDGNIHWEGIEVRNPKDLIDMDGNKYDGDNPKELIDNTSPNYDASNSKHVNTAKVKKYIKDLVTMKAAITDAYATYQASSKTEQDVATFKAVFEAYLDPDNVIDYTIFSDVSNNYDGFYKNWQWLTYNGVKWYISLYDCDGVFGGFNALNDTILPPLTNHLTIEQQQQAWLGGNWIFDIIFDVYQTPLEARYKELRNNAIINTDNIVSMLSNWLDRIGNKNVFDKEWAKWPFVKNDSIHRMYKWVVESINNMDIVYNYNQN